MHKKIRYSDVIVEIFLFKYAGQFGDVKLSSKMSSKTSIFLGLHLIFTEWFIYNESRLHLTYDSTVSALQCGAGARDCSTGAGAAEDGAAGCAVEC